MTDHPAESRGTETQSEADYHINWWNGVDGRRTELDKRMEASIRTLERELAHERQNIGNWSDKVAAERRADAAESELDSKTALYQSALEQFEAVSRKLATAESELARLREPTEQMADAVRGVLQLLRGQPGVSFGEIKKHCTARGDALTGWPQWADDNAVCYVTEQGAAQLIYTLMVAALEAPK